MVHEESPKKPRLQREKGRSRTRGNTTLRTPLDALRERNKQLKLKKQRRSLLKRSGVIR